MKNVLVVSNYNAGRKQAVLHKKVFHKFLMKNSEHFRFISIEEFEFVNIDLYDTIFAIGGDGTVNKIIPSIINTDKVLGIIPCGTAIQNARNTSFNELGDGGELTYDTLHLQEGVPRLIDAFVCSQYLLDNYLGGGSISGVTFFPDEEFLASWKSLGKKGSPVGVNRSNVEKCKQLALKSIEQPFILFEQQ